MIRRTQLLEPESRSSSSLQFAAIVDRLRDGLLSDNKVVPAVLGGLALLIFAWLIAGAFVGDADVQEEQQASNQASLAQEDSKSGGAETPAPDVENPDTESYSEFGDPEDPFYPSSDIEDLFSKSGGGNNGDNNNGRNGDGDGGGNGGNRGNDGGNGDRGADRDDDGGDFIEQDSPPRGSQSPDDSPPPSGEPDADLDSGPGGDPGQGGSGDLFNSGGDLPAP